MIAVDTSTIVAYLQGALGKDTDLLDDALRAKQVILPPVVLTELLSDPKLGSDVVTLLNSFPKLEVTEGYWERAGATRALVLAKGNKARIADALIAQSCLDHRISLLTRDRDFGAFAKICGLVLLSP